MYTVGICFVYYLQLFFSYVNYLSKHVRMETPNQSVSHCDQLDGHLTGFDWNENKTFCFNENDIHFLLLFFISLFFFRAIWVYLDRFGMLFIPIVPFPSSIQCACGYKSTFLLHGLLSKTNHFWLNVSHEKYAYLKCTISNWCSSNWLQNHLNKLNSSFF